MAEQSTTIVKQGLLLFSSIRIESFSNLKRLESLDETQIKIFARRSSANLPIVGATVMALIHRSVRHLFQGIQKGEVSLYH